MNGFLSIISSILSSVLQHLLLRSRTGIDADDDVGRLRRAGNRIDKWLRQSRVRSGDVPNASGSKLEDAGLHAGGGQVDQVEQPDRSS